MKWLLLIASLFLKPFSRLSGNTVNPVAEIKEFFVDNAKKVILAFMVTSIVSSTFVAGLIITVITMSAQYDQNAGIGLSAMLLGGIAMMVISLIGAWVVLAPSRESREMERQARSIEQQGHPLSDALVLLVQDFIKEREFKRSQFSDEIRVREYERSAPDDLKRQ